MPRKLSRKQRAGHKIRVDKIRKSNPEFFQEIGSIGGHLTTTRYTSESGKEAANKRWENYRKEQERKLNEVTGQR